MKRSIRVIVREGIWEKIRNQCKEGKERTSDVDQPNLNLSGRCRFNINFRKGLVALNNLQNDANKRGIDRVRGLRGAATAS